MRRWANIICLVTVFVVGCQEQRSAELKFNHGSVAFSRLSGDYWQIWTIQPDGSGARQVTSSPCDKRYPAWSANGNGIYFRTNNNTVATVDIETGREKRILADLGLVDGVAASPAEFELIFTRYRSELKDSGDLWLASCHGNNGRVLTRDVGIQHEPCWSADGERIVYISSHGYRTSEIYTIDAGGGNKHRLTDNNAREALPVFSPISSQICYCSDVSGDYEIWVMDVQGGNRRRLTFSDGIDTRPYWSPDGSEIVFSSNRDGALQLWIMNADGTNLRQLTDGAPSMDAVWRWN